MWLSLPCSLSMNSFDILVKNIWWSVLTYLMPQVQPLDSLNQQVPKDLETSLFRPLSQSDSDDPC
uniref:Uncharacterized protein n=1 Tax=Arundo donax TaxID=35708 RepID=A0A0A8Z3G9_ARUDO